MTDSPYMDKAREALAALGIDWTDGGSRPGREINSRKKRATHAIATALQEAAEGKWMPIETAPFQGPPVLLWRDGEYFTAKRITGEHGPGWCTPDGYQIFNAKLWMPITPPKAGE